MSTPIATYAEAEAGMDVVVGYAYAGPAPEGTEVVELPRGTAVCGVHLGPMTSIQESWQDLHRWVINNGYSFAGPSREFYVRAESDDQADWVIELHRSPNCVHRTNDGHRDATGCSPGGTSPGTTGDAVALASAWRF